MSGDWDFRRFEEAPLEIIDGDRGVNYPKQSEFSSAGYCLFLNAGNVTSEGFDFSDCAFISKEKDETLRKGKLSRYDSVLTTRGTVGNVALYDESVPFEHVRINSGMVIVRPDREQLNPKFLSLFLRSKLFSGQVEALTTGSAQPQLPIRDIKRVELPLPDLDEQKDIAEILSSLDEKIELNRKQNRTLEAIAQALFKRWFVEFEFPDENGRPYQSSGGAMQPSELGEIPVGWRTGKLEELIGELETGSRPKGGVGMFTDGIPSIGAESITRIGEYDYAKTKYVPEEYFAKMRRGVIKDRDVLIYKDGGTPGRFDVRISMFGGGFPFEVACINEHVFRVQAKKPIYQNYLYLWFSSYPVLEELRHRGAKAAIPGINSNDVKELDFLFMDEVVLEKFDEVIEPLFAKLLRNSREMAALARLRDALLPKLMSGELRVGDAA